MQKLSCISEISAKVNGGATFYVHPVVYTHTCTCRYTETPKTLRRRFAGDKRTSGGLRTVATYGKKELARKMGRVTTAYRGEIKEAVFRRTHCAVCISIKLIERPVAFARPITHGQGRFHDRLALAGDNISEFVYRSSVYA